MFKFDFSLMKPESKISFLDKRDRFIRTFSFEINIYLQLM